MVSDAQLNALCDALCEVVEEDTLLAAYALRKVATTLDLPPEDPYAVHREKMVREHRDEYPEYYACVKRVDEVLLRRPIRTVGYDDPTGDDIAADA